MMNELDMKNVNLFKTLDEVRLMSDDAADYSKNYCTYLSYLISNMDHDAIGRIAGAFIEAGKNNNTIYFIGNGGSAATATHFACDIGKGTKRSDKGYIFRTQSLADNLATFTAYANDDGFEHVFSRQLENVLNAGDVVVAITASGNSMNLVNAIEYARGCNAKTIGLLGFDGGKLKDMCDISIIVRTPKGEYGPVEDAHMMIDHMITSYINDMYEKRKDAGISEGRK